MKQTMKKYTILLAGLLSAVLFTSCNDMLETTNYSDMSPVNFFTSEGDFDAAVTGLYAPCTTNWGYSDLGSGNWHNAIFCADNNAHYAACMVSTDIVTPYSSGNATAEFTMGPSTWGPYFHTYNVIRFVARATDIIDNIQKSTGSTQEIRDRYVAESKVLRAYYMWMLWDWFGPVSARLNPESLYSTEFEARPSNETYVQWMLNDIEDAINCSALPVKYNGDESNWGRMSKSIAYAIRMRIYMHEKEWAKAKADAETIMGMGYSLVGNYEDIFNNTMTSEHIWSIPSNTSSDDFYITEILPGDFWEGTFFGGDSYQRGDGSNNISGWQAYCMRWDFYDTFADNDLRKKTIIYEYKDKNGNVHDRSNGMVGAIPIKFTDSQFNEYGINKTGGPTKEHPVIRYAEILLAYAEAENQLNGPTANAIAAVKQITDRAGIEIPAEAKASKDAFDNFILEESGRELYCEGHRRTDLIRHGEFIKRAQARGVTNAKDYMTLYPIPQTAITEAGGIVEQNPGYTN
jgi:starch-binding outer membrane protein, SusD/RagB family